MFCTQCLVLLCSEPPDEDVIRQHLESLGYTVNASGCITAEQVHYCLELAERIPQGGWCEIVVTATPWPDDLTEPGVDPKTSITWHLGGYGNNMPLGALANATQGTLDPDAEQTVPAHRAFIRIRARSFGHTEEQRNEAKPSYDAKEEFLWLLALTEKLCSLPEVLAYFNPSGAVLMTPAFLRLHLQDDPMPLLAIASPRITRVDDTWRLADLVGLSQLGLPDLEFAIPDNFIKPSAIVERLQDVGHYVASQSKQFQSGHTVDGPDDKVWRAQLRDSSCYYPYRPVVHFLPKNLDPSVVIPSALQPCPPAQETSSAEKTATAEGDGRDESWHRLAHLTETWLAEIPEITARGRAWLKSSQFKTIYEDLHVTGLARFAYPLMHPLKALRDLPLIRKLIGYQSKKLWQQYQDLADLGVTILTSPIISNVSMHWDPYRFAPSLLVSADDQNLTDVSYSCFVSDALGKMYTFGKGAAERPDVASILADDTYHYFRRRPLPVGDAPGFKATLIDIMLKQAWMPPDEIPFIPVLAMPSGKGALVQIPWDIALGRPLPPKPSSPPPIPTGPPVPKGYRRPPQPLPETGFLGAVAKTVKAILALLGGLLVLGFIITFLPHRCGFKAPPKLSEVEELKLAQPDALPLRFDATPDILKKFTPIALTEYEPLQQESGMAFTFSFDQRKPVVLAATSPKTPSITSLSQGQQQMELTTLKASLQKRSQIYQVQSCSDTTHYLSFNPADELHVEEELAVIIGKGQLIKGTLAMAVGKHTRRLGTAPTVLRLNFKTPTSLVGKLGAPVVNLEKGRVVGIVVGADKPETATMLEFETICANPESN
jgi:hypothetical protein